MIQQGICSDSWRFELFYKSIGLRFCKMNQKSNFSAGTTITSSLKTRSFVEFEAIQIGTNQHDENDGYTILFSVVPYFLESNATLKVTPPSGMHTLQIESNAAWK